MLNIHEKLHRTHGPHRGGDSAHVLRLQAQRPVADRIGFRGRRLPLCPHPNRMRSRAPNQRRRSPPTRNADSRRRPGDSGNHPKQKNEVRSSGTDHVRSVRENKEKAEVLASAFRVNILL